MDVGATLRRARQEHDLSIEELSDAIKVTPASLHALETNDFERLPATVYTRGFLRAYAREVGLDPEEISGLYLREMEDALALRALERRAEAIEAAAAAAEEAAAKRARAAQREADARRAAAAQRRAAAEARIAAAVERYRHATHAGASSVTATVQRISGATSRIPIDFHVDLRALPRPAQAAAAAAMLVLVVGAVFLRGDREGAEIANAQAVQSAVAPAAAASVPLESDAVRTSHIVAEGMTIELTATGACWVSASADRSPVLSRLLQAGDRETIEARDEFVLRVGDPSTISLTINGAPVRSLGRAGMPVTVQINKQNLRDFVTAIN